MTSTHAPPPATEAGAPQRHATWATEPFVMGTPAQFARLREWLPAVHFTEAELCAVAGVPRIGQLPQLDSKRTAFAKPVDVQSLLVHLFLDGRPVPWSTVRGILGPADLSVLTDLGLLQPSVASADNCVGTVALFPTEDLYVVSDRLVGAETVGGSGLPADLVYTPLTAETQRFIALMPRERCDDYLELCAGTGIAALLAAKHFARYAYSADITTRSTRFARFNAALNDLPNVTAVEGDLYAPVAGKMFDMIAAHPPYVPAESTEMVFRDGGEDGEQITRRIIAGLPDHLRPGGLYYMAAAMTDRGSDPIEQRMRRMLGPAEDEFDVIVYRRGVIDTKVYQAGQLAAGRLSPEAFARQQAYFKRVGIERLVPLNAIIQRRVEPRPVVTRQHLLGDAARAADLLWLVRYASATVQWGADEMRRLLDARLRAIPGTELRVRSVLEDGAWKPVSTIVRTTQPFAVETQCPPWFPHLLARCDGKMTAREHLERLRAEGGVQASVADDNFAELIHELANVPLVEIDQFPLPPPKVEESSRFA